MEFFVIFLIQFVSLFFLSRILTRNLSRALFRITKNPNLAIRFFHLLFLPGVILHELSHLLTAEVMLVKTHGLNLMPVRNGDELTMGSVEINKCDPVRRSIIGFAPVLVGFTVISLTTFYLLSESSIFSQLTGYVLIFIIVFEIGNTMFTSKKDLEGSIEIILLLLILLALAYLFNVDFQPFVDIVNSSNAQNLLLQGIKILTIPIFVDVAIIGISKLLTSRN